MATLLEIRNLKKYFKTKYGMLHAVDDVTFSLDAHKTLGVVGESGCGKTTLGRTILHLTEPTSGQILFGGQDISAPTKNELFELRKRMQIIFQDPLSSLNPRMSLSESIMEPLVLCGGIPKADMQNEVRKMMDTVGIALRFEHAYPHELDGGTRQRIGIARALILKPEFIVCDEPVSALDVSIQAQIINLLAKLKEQRSLSYLFISHDLSVVEHISDVVGVMYLGSLVEYGDRKDIFAEPAHPYTKALFSAIPIPDPDNKMKRIVLEGSIPSPADPPSGCKFHTRCPYSMDRCKSETPQQREIGPGHYCVCHLYDK